MYLLLLCLKYINSIPDANNIFLPFGTRFLCLKCLTGNIWGIEGNKTLRRHSIGSDKLHLGVILKT